MESTTPQLSQMTTVPTEARAASSAPLFDCSAPLPPNYPAPLPPNCPAPLPPNYPAPLPPNCPVIPAPRYNNLPLYLREKKNRRAPQRTKEMRQTFQSRAIGMRPARRLCEDLFCLNTQGQSITQQHYARATEIMLRMANAPIFSNGSVWPALRSVMMEELNFATERAQCLAGYF